MIEEFDTYSSLNLFRLTTVAAALLLAGVALEFALRLGRRWAENRGLLWLAALLNALTWQPLLWAVLLGIVWPALEIIETVTGWQQTLDARQMIAMIAITVVVVRLLSGLLSNLTASTPSASVSLLNNVLYGLGALIVTAILLGYIFGISPVILLLAIVGAVTGLTVVFQDPIENLVSGISLTVSRRLSPGDAIRLPSGVEGTVIDIQWDVTVVRQISNNYAIVPNSIMTDAEIVNYDRPDPVLSVPVEVGVSYESDLAHVEAVALEEARNAMHAINGDAAVPDPVVRYKAFADSSINFKVTLRASRYLNRSPLMHDFIKRLHERFNAEGIEIPFPIRTLQMSPDHPLYMEAQDGDGERRAQTAAAEGMART
jgi:small-conductance mechanosensitive channel